MTFKRARARVAERSTTSGSGPWTLGGVLDNSYQAFSSFLSNGDTIEVTVREPGVAVWSGKATFGSSGSPAVTTITPTTVEETYGTFGSGTKEISADFLASRALHKEDISGQIVTGGTSTAYTVSSFRNYDTLTRLHGEIIGFTPHTANGQNATLSVDGLTAKPLRLAPSVDIQSNSLSVGTPYQAIYNSTDGAFYLHLLGENSLGIPLGAAIEYWGATLPSSAYVRPAGQALNRVTYARLFALFSTDYGSGDGSTTFNVFDKRGRASAMTEDSASRLTSSWFVGNSTNRGATGGGESNALSSTNQIPQFTPSGSVSSSLTSGNAAVPIQGSTVPGSPVSAALQGNNTSGGTTLNSPVTGTVSSSFSGNSVGSGSPSSFRTLPPMITCNYILRVL